jgi:TRAP-type C4-dicarboxylate transport system substrate-binding protein
MKKATILTSSLLVVLLVIGMVFSCTSKTEPTQPTQPTQPSKPKEPIVLRIVIPSPPGDELTVKDEELAARFNERVGGDYVMKVYGGDSIVKTPEYLDAVRTGAVEMMDVGWPIYAGIEPTLGIPEMPFLFEDVRGFASIEDDIITLYDPILTEKYNQKALGCFTTGGFELSGNKEVKTLADWKGTLVGCPGKEAAVLTDSLGGGSVIIMWIELYSNLDKGVVDNCLLSFSGILALKITDVIKYVTKFYGTSSFNGYTINLDIWNKMPANVQNILLEEIEKTTTEWSDIQVGYDMNSAERFKKVGFENFYVLPKAERDKWAEKLQPYLNEQFVKYGELGEKFKQLAAAANKKYPYPY